MIAGWSPRTVMPTFDEPEIFRTILENLTTGLCVVDMQKRILLWSNGAERITGLSRHEVVGHSCVSEALLHCDQPGCEFCKEDCPVAIAMKTSQPIRTTGFVHHKVGHEVPVSIRAIAVHNEHGSIIGAVETFENLQQAANSDRGEPKRQFPDCVDTTTGVANRAMMLSRLRQSLASFAELGVPFGVLLFRVEELALFRARLGQEAAASLLRVVARTLESAVWINDSVGRWSDDQFLVILSGCREDALSFVRERARRTLAAESIEWWGERRSLPVSIGQALIQPSETVEVLMERAETSLDSSSKWRTGSCATQTEPSSGS